MTAAVDLPGLFNESLPAFLREQDAAAAAGRLDNCTYVHIDCDLYVGTSYSAERQTAPWQCTARSCLALRICGYASEGAHLFDLASARPHLCVAQAPMTL